MSQDVTNTPGDAPQPAEAQAALTPGQLDQLPRLPGVYIMHDAQGKVLYIGKAVNLHSRVHSYFTKAGDARFNVRYLMRHVASVRTIITANEKEALLLENTLIKQHQPRYNIRLRDDKTYVSVRINLNQTWPRAVVMRRRGEQAKPGEVYLGPYASASAVRDTLRQLQRVFPIRSCADSVLNNRTRPCLLHQIGRCCAPCARPVVREDYMEMVEGLILFLKGKTRDVVRRLSERMMHHSDLMEFEQAAVLRDRIQAIEQTTERQGVHSHTGSERDVVALVQEGGHGAFIVFVYRNGLLVSSRPFLVRDHDRPADELLEEFLTRYYDLETPPRELLLSAEPAGRELLEEWLAERRGGTRCEVNAPQRGEKKRLVETAEQNAQRLLEQHLSGQVNAQEMLEEIQSKLKLPALPQVMECYDISTIQGFATVGSQVTFSQGEPDKSRYRRYRIRTLEGQDDFGALTEVLGRRLDRIARGDDTAPDLLVIDGGKGQLAVAVHALEEAGLTIPVVGMAKARVKRRGSEQVRTEERFFLPGRANPVTFKSNNPALYLLERLRDETHRFGITYHRELRTRLNLRSVLEEIPGVGKGRAKTLLRRFGSLDKIKEATPEQLTQEGGLPENLAQAVWSRLQETAGAEQEKDRM